MRQGREERIGRGDQSERDSKDHRFVFVLLFFVSKMRRSKDSTEERMENGKGKGKGKNKENQYSHKEKRKGTEKEKRINEFHEETFKKGKREKE